ncbi:hypothetical protein [Bifidobacterium sp. ESL0800]|uniref:hypothetical protein n=1 Tax=Bifidobacterium sp. ESL0800 TaxID=2983236 RepID=UPI0023F76A1A|nr:hypothetical protein [Bifidobacterium sp. ESL0800]WEV75100.1 hypothetical protein OZX75_05475 [Bifidobacterium sp. ESL0800]
MDMFVVDECASFGNFSRDTPQMWITPIIRPHYPFQLAFPGRKWIEWIYEQCTIDSSASTYGYALCAAQKDIAACRGERKTRQEVAGAKAGFRDFLDSASGKVAVVCETPAVSLASPVARARIAEFPAILECA